MILKGIDFGHIFTASGTLNFFGQGWPYHKLYRKIFYGFNFSGSTFISKTTTLNERIGNLSLDKNLMNRKFFPDCIKVYPLKGLVLNAVGLSGPGTKLLLQKNIWQNMKNPFFISFMAVGNSKEERLNEMAIFTEILIKELKNFQSLVGLQINISCPNTKHCTADLKNEAIELLLIARPLGIPLDLKVNALTSPIFVKELADTGLCDCLTCSNTIPWGALPEKIDWNKLFGSGLSPLAKYGGGGLSGWPLLKIVAEWIRQARDAGIILPIKAGGGILNVRDLLVLKDAGANAVEIGSAAILRPWRIRSIINNANLIFQK